MSHLGILHSGFVFNADYCAEPQPHEELMSPRPAAQGPNEALHAGDGTDKAA